MQKKSASRSARESRLTELCRFFEIKSREFIDPYLARLGGDCKGGKFQSLSSLSLWELREEEIICLDNAITSCDSFMYGDENRKL